MVNQFAFITNRNILGNILIAYESLEEYRKGKKKFKVTKLNLEKAYD